MKHQREFVINQLKLNGFISRNFALKNFITRLSAIIQNLEEVGWGFSTEYVKGKNGKNFVYTVVKSPLKKTIYTVPELQKSVTIYR